MEGFLSIGFIQIPIKWIFIGLGLFGAYVTIMFRMRRVEINKKELINIMFNALFYGFIVWKLSYVLFNPVYTFANPLGIVYFNGGQKGVLLGIITAVIYMLFQSSKQKVEKRIIFDLYITGWLSGSLIYLIYLVESNHFYYFGQILLAILLLTIIATKYNEIGNPKQLRNIILIYSLGQIFLDYQSYALPFFLGFTMIQVLFIVISILIVVWNMKNAGD